MDMWADHVDIVGGGYQLNCPWFSHVALIPLPFPGCPPSINIM